MTFANIYDVNLEPLFAGDEVNYAYEIDTDSDFDTLEKRAKEFGAKGKKCCIQWENPTDGTIAYWSPHGSTFEPHWY